MLIDLMRFVKEVEIRTVEVDGEERFVLNNRVAISNVNSDKGIFIDVTAWGTLAEFITTYLEKGDEFLGIGELKTKKNKFFKEDGEAFTIDIPYILLREIKFTHGKKPE